MRLGIGLGVSRSTGGGVPLPPFDIADISGLVAWYDAANGITKDGSNRVSAWANQVTGDPNTNLAQATPGNQPLWNATDANLNNQPSVTFSSSRHDQMSTPAWATPLPNPATWVCFGRLTSIDYPYVSIHDGLGDPYRNVAYYLQSTTKLHLLSGTWPTDVLAGDAEANGTEFAHVEVFGLSGRIYQQSYTPYEGSTGTQTQQGLIVGNAYTGTQWFNGQIAELYAFDRALSQAEVEQILNWGGAKYGITIGA
jgi:hypothetical protein